MRPGSYPWSSAIPTIPSLALYLELCSMDGPRTMGSVLGICPISLTLRGWLSSAEAVHLQDPAGLQKG